MHGTKPPCIDAFAGESGAGLFSVSVDCVVATCKLAFRPESESDLCVSEGFFALSNKAWIVFCVVCADDGVKFCVVCAEDGVETALSDFVSMMFLSA